MCLRFLLKCFLIVVNIVFVLLGIALIVLGVLIKFQLQDYIKELENMLANETDGNLSLSTLGLPLDLGYLAYIFIGLGVIIFVIAFCGCCGSIVNSKWMLVTYTIFMAILLAIKVAALVILLTNAASVKEEVNKFVNDAFDQPEMNITFHVIEALLHCCGTDGPDSYDISYEGVYYVPATCCPNALDQTETTPSINSTVCRKEEAFTDGCSTVIVEFAEMVLNTSRNVLVIIIIAEAVLLLSAVTIACTIKNKIKKQPYY